MAGLLALMLLTDAPRAAKTDAAITKGLTLITRTLAPSRSVLNQLQAAIAAVRWAD